MDLDEIDSVLGGIHSLNIALTFSRKTGHPQQMELKFCCLYTV